MSYVIGKIFSGLGNQLFQYAAAEGLAAKTAQKLVFCNTAHLDVKRPYGLGGLIPEEQLLTHQQNRAIRWWVESKGASLPRKGAKLLRLPGRVECVTDAENGFDPRIETLPGNLILYGYWQNELYFAHIRESIAGRIRNAFQIESTAEADASVCVHVRRGDYLTAAEMALMPLEYFERAMDYLRSKRDAPRFTVFSDDPEWCRQQFRKYSDVSVFDTSGKPQDQIQDFRRMATFSHFIISNSSYSWWTAYLGTNPTKIVVAPKQWWRSAERSSADPALSQWVRL